MAKLLAGINIGFACLMWYYAVTLDSLFHWPIGLANWIAAGLMIYMDVNRAKV